mgnify:CR=1 FL=1|jgi:hypothetical protein
MNKTPIPSFAADAWQRAEDEHLRDALRLTFKERLMWLEEAAHVASRLSSPRVVPPEPKEPARRSA